MNHFECDAASFLPFVLYQQDLMVMGVSFPPWPSIKEAAFQHNK